jgi:predicted site-specific integrase-resolvase
VYESLRNESIKKLLAPEVAEEVLVIQRTSSKKCKEDELSQVEDEEGNQL